MTNINRVKERRNQYTPTVIPIRTHPENTTDDMSYQSHSRASRRWESDRVLFYSAIWEYHSEFSLWMYVVCRKGSQPSTLLPSILSGAVLNYCIPVASLRWKVANGDVQRETILIVYQPWPAITWQNLASYKIMYSYNTYVFISNSDIDASTAINSQGTSWRIHLWTLPVKNISCDQAAWHNTLA